MTYIIFLELLLLVYTFGIPFVELAYWATSTKSQWRFFVTPFVGLSVFLIFSIIGHLVGYNTGTLAKTWLIFLTILYAGLYFKFRFYKERDSLYSIWILELKDHVFVIIAMLFVGFICLKPLIDSKSLGWGGGGTDSVTYIRIASYIIDNSIFNALKNDFLSLLSPWKGHVLNVLKGEHLGGLLIFGGLSSVLNRDPYQVFNPLLALYAALTVLTSYKIAKTIFNIRKYPATIMALLLCLHSYWLMPHYTTFLNQTSGIAFGLFAIVLVSEAVNKLDYFLAAVAGLAVLFLFNCYAVFSFFLLPTFLFFILSNFIKDRKSIKKLFVIIFLSIGVTIFFEFLLGGRNILRTIEIKTQSPGFKIFSYYQNIPHFLSFFTNYMPPHFRWEQISMVFQLVFVVSSLFSFFCFFIGVFRLQLLHRIHMILLFVFIGLFCSWGLWNQQGYGVWKVLTLAQPIFFIATVNGCLLLYERVRFILKKESTKNYNQWAFIMFSAWILFLVGLHLHSGKILTENFFYIQPKEIVELKEWAPKINDLLKNEDHMLLKVDETTNIYDHFSIIYMLRNVKTEIPKESPLFKALIVTPYKNEIISKAKLVLEPRSDQADCLIQNRFFCLRDNS